MEKIIFLDIDGPLIPERAFYLPGNQFCFGTVKKFDPIAVALINQLAAFTQAKVVISSTWRKAYDKEWLVNHFAAEGLNIELHDEWQTPWKFTSQRFHEIHFWLDDWSEDNPGEEIQYVIIDDIPMPANFFGLADNAVEVDYNNGFSLENFYQALKILDADVNEFHNCYIAEKTKFLQQNKPEK